MFVVYFLTANGAGIERLDRSYHCGRKNDPLAVEEPADHGQFNSIIRGVNVDHFSLDKTAHNNDPQQSLDFGRHSGLDQESSNTY
jgi:hypothetical protein